MFAAGPWLAAAGRLEAVGWADPTLGLMLAVEALVPFLQHTLDVTGPLGEVIASGSMLSVAMVMVGGVRLRLWP